MSCYHGIRCLDCREDWDTWENHGEHEMRAIAAEGAALAAFAPALERLSKHVWECGIKLDSVTLVHSDLAWLAKHAGHRLVEVSEIGVVDGTCGEFAPGPGPLRICVVEGDRDHAGPHVYEEAWGKNICKSTDDAGRK